MSYVLRKLGFYAVALWAALTLNFAIPRLLPGNPVDILLAKLQQRGGTVTPETRKAYALLLGGDDDAPLWSQYLSYLGNLSQGDLGVSVSYYPAKVSDVIMSSLLWTVVLVGIATIVAALAGVLLGAIVGWRRGTWLDSLVPSTTLLAAMPYFWLALLLALPPRPGCWAGSRCSGGYDVELTPGWNGPFIASARHYGVLPAADDRALASVGGWLLGMRNMMVSTLSEDYVADRGGQGPAAEQDHGALRGAQRGPALGRRVRDLARLRGLRLDHHRAGLLLPRHRRRGCSGAVQNNDYALMQGIFLVITLAVLAANLVVDLLYGLIDPRTRASTDRWTPR